jgi:hypothetical protein
MQMPVSGREPPIELLRAQGGEHGEQRAPVRPHAAVAIDHLVEDARQRAIARQQRPQIGGRDIVPSVGGVALGCHRSIRPWSDA